MAEVANFHFFFFGRLKVQRSGTLISVTERVESIASSRSSKKSELINRTSFPFTPPSQSISQNEFSRFFFFSFSFGQPWPRLINFLVANNKHVTYFCLNVFVCANWPRIELILCSACQLSAGVAHHLWKQFSFIIY